MLAFSFYVSCFHSSYLIPKTVEEMLYCTFAGRESIMLIDLEFEFASNIILEVGIEFPVETLLTIEGVLDIEHTGQCSRPLIHFLLK